MIVGFVMHFLCYFWFDNQITEDRGLIVLLTEFLAVFV